MHTPKTHGEPDDPLALFESEREASGGQAPQPPESPVPPQTLEASVPAGSDNPTDINDTPGLDASPGSQTGQEADTVSIQAILDARTPVHWVEAVAIVVGACDALINDDGSETPAPEPQGILIDRSGSVLVSPGKPKGSSADRLGRTLHALSTTEPMPAPLRLLVSTWIESREQHSVAEVRRELGHFAKPNTGALARDVYDRHMEASDTPVASTPPVVPERPLPASEPPVPATAQELPLAAAEPPVSAATPDLPLRASELPSTLEPTAEAPAPVPPSDDPNVSQPAVVIRTSAQLWRKLPFDIMVPAGVACAVVLLGLLFWLMSPGGAPVPTSSQASVAVAPGTIPAAALAPVSNVAAASSIPPPIPFGQDIELPAEPEAAPRAPSRRTARPAPRPQANANAAPVNQAANQARAAATPRATPGTSTATTAPVPAIVGPTANSASAAEPLGLPIAPGVGGGPVYTGTDAGVEPPVMIYPQVKPSAIGGSESAYNTMEIVISERGLVEQVRLLSEPKRMTDMMLLSGAKTWRFLPASIDGESVRYRMAITWPTTR